MDSASDRDVVGLVENGPNLACTESFDIEKHNGCSPFGGSFSVDGDAWDFTEAVEDLLGDHHFVIVIDGGIHCSNQTGETDGVGRAGFECIGEVLGHFESGRGRPGSASAFAENPGIGTRIGKYAWADIKRSGPGWAAESFVPGDGQQVDVVALNINGKVPDGLGSINDENHFGVSRADGLDDFFDRLDGAENIGCVRNSDKHSALIARIGDRLRIECAFAITGHDFQIEHAFSSKAVQRTEHCVVIDSRRDDMDL